MIHGRLRHLGNVGRFGGISMSEEDEESYTFCILPNLIQIHKLEKKKQTKQINVSSVLDLIGQNHVYNDSLEAENTHIKDKA